MTYRLAIALAVLGAACAPSLTRASDAPWSRGVDLAREARDRAPVTPSLTLDPSMASDEKVSVLPDAKPSQSMLTLDAGSGSSFQLHGFGDFRMSNAYITPRGLLVSNQGVHGEPTLGLVFDVYQGTGFVNDFSFILGTWGDFTSSHPNANAWIEQDYFGGFDVKFAKNFDFAYTIMAWTFPSTDTPESNPTNEYNMDFKFSFNDSDYLHDFALHPYVDIFWNFAGQSSPVVADALLGKNDYTMYAEFGIAPSYTYKGIPELPITFTMPSYVSVGDSSFWGETPGGDRSNLGVASTGLKISVPLKFIPSNFGSWNAYVGVTYIYTCNPALSYVNENILANGDSHNLILGYAGLSFGF